jgi:two-component system nitrogen regulation sensor histidine kinase NtrY
VTPSTPTSTRSQPPAHLAAGAPPLDRRERRKRKREGIAIVALAVLFVALTLAEFKLTKVSSTLPFVTSIFFFGLLNVNIVILIALIWLVFRNLGKLFIERRRKILGARLKTKLVLAFVAFSLIPTLVLFAISAMYINSSFDKWFSLKIQNTLQASLEITHTYYLNTEHTAMHFAEHLASGIGRRMPAPSAGPNGAEDLSAALKPAPAWIEGYLESQRDLMALDAAEFYSGSFEPRLLAQRGTPTSPADTFPRLSLDLLDKAFSGESFCKLQHVGTGDMIRCLSPVHAGASEKTAIVGVLVVSSYIPVSLVNKVDEIASVFDDYKDTNPLKYPMKTTYLVILIMITLVIIFVAIWIGLYLARELTVPVERLVYGAQAVGAGNLDVRVPAFGHDEIATLVQSFNKMTQDLRDNRARLIQAGNDLEKRRLQLEAVLANVNTGVISIDSGGEITTFNPAAAKLLRIAPGDAVGRKYRDVFKGEAAQLAEVIGRTVESANRSGVASLPENAQWNFRTGEPDSANEHVTSLSAVVTPLHESEAHWGVVAVVDDMTHLIKGQREMAWREVARRIAHEIKNPLTPIKLSAQRLQRRLGSGQPRTAETLALLQECTETIIKHTDELKEMVNEFSNFARFPEANPAPHDLNATLKESLKLFEQGHQDVEFKLSLEPKLPIFEFDRDQIKRVVINLLDNAVAALQAKPPGRPRRVTVSTHYHDQLQIAVLEVGDNGPGMTDEVKGRVFEPYFSTKKEGTGLGLAIAKRIVNDHDGFIRIHSAPGEGTKFVIELPTSQRLGPERRRSRQGAVAGKAEA